MSFAHRYPAHPRLRTLKWLRYLVRYLFAEEQENWLRRYIGLTNEIPAQDMIAKVVTLIAPNQFKLAFRMFCIFIKYKQDKIIPMDDKNLCGNVDHVKEQFIGLAHLLRNWFSACTGQNNR